MNIIRPTTPVVRSVRITFAALMLLVIGSVLAAEESPGILLGGEAASRKTSEAAADVKTASTDAERRSALRALLKTRPKDGDDIRALASLFESLSSVSRPAVLRCLESLEMPVGTSARNELASLVMTKDDELLGTVLRLCALNMVSEAIKPIRRRLATEHKMRIRDREVFSGLSRRAHFGDPFARAVFRVRELGITLGRLGDVASVDLLFGLDEVICSGSAGEALSSLGLPALNKAVQVARMESGERRRGALDVISLTTTPSALGTLQVLVKDHDPEIRKAAVLAIAGSDSVSGAAILSSLRGELDPKVRYVAWSKAIYANPAKFGREIVSSIREELPLSRGEALLIASTGKVPGIDRELRQFIKDDEKRNGRCANEERYNAARGIWKLTGQKVEYMRCTHTYPPPMARIMKRNSWVDPYPWDPESIKRDSENRPEGWR
ncbi:MAG TPA: HEAT repeat domain-containing protein [Nitrospira sp.]|nr:HEAT repeat domain-containing protein [Nitrospira sp.]